MRNGITSLEVREYFQNGCIRIKDVVADKSFLERFAYYGHDVGYKSYEKIDFEDEFDSYRCGGSPSINPIVFCATFVHPEYGFFVVENHHENYLVELREQKFVPDFFRLIKKKGYKAEVVGSKPFICIWKKLKS